MIPTRVNQAVIAIWAGLGLYAIVAVVDRQMGAISSDMFMGYILMGAILCIFPYKISRGSNPSRYIYTILVVIGYLMMLAGETNDMTKLESIMYYLLIPVDIFIFYQLFNGESNDWFSRDRIS